MPVQMRLAGGSDNRFYAPNRDLAYCSPHLIKRAMDGLDPDRQEPWVKDYLEQHKISEEELVKGAKCLADYMNIALTDPENEQPFDALKVTGFFDLSQPVQAIVCAKLGQILISTVFTCIRDITKDPKEPPYSIKEISQIAQDMTNKWVAYNSMPWWKKYFLKTIKELRKRIGM